MQEKKIKAIYVPPENDTEKIICAAFEKVLRIVQIGVDDDFWDLGGESAKSLIQQSICENINLTPRMIYEGRTPRKIAELYNSQTEVLDFETTFAQENYPLTDSQLGVYLTCAAQPLSMMYNIHCSVCFPIVAGIDAIKLKSAVQSVVNAYPFLKVHIGTLENEPSLVPDNKLLLEIPV